MSATPQARRRACLIAVAVAASALSAGRVLHAQTASQEQAPELLLREVDITSQRPVIDLAGARITEASFAARFDVHVVPVVALFDQALKPLAEPLVGLDRSGFYEGYLATAIDAARKRLRQTS